MDAWPAGVGREIHAVLDSTNAEALRRAAAGEAGPVWILAQRQTAARGRRGRAWAMPPGNFAATLLARPPGALALRSFVAALGLYDAMVAVTGRPELFALKWPNDVLLSGGKLAGILLESGAGGTVAVGIGVNLAAAPAPDALEAGAVAPVSLSEARPASRWRRRISSTCWRRRCRPGRRGCAQRASRRCARRGWRGPARLGEEITARLPDRALTGRFETVDETGALVLATADRPGGAAGGRDPFRRSGACCSPLTSATPTRSSRCTTASGCVGEWRCRTERQRTADEYFVWLRQLMDFGMIEGDDRLGGGLVGGAAGAVQLAGARRSLLPDPRQGGRPARREAAGGAAGRSRDPGRRRPAGQHRRARTTATAAISSSSTSAPPPPSTWWTPTAPTSAG